MNVAYNHWNGRVGGSIRPGRYPSSRSPSVFLWVGDEHKVRVAFDPDEARHIARELKKWADFIEPNKK